MRRIPPVASVADRLKRVLVGRALSSEKMEHQLLPKALALPVFASDPLSSVAYATEEMMLALALAGAAALGLMLPIGMAIAVVLLVVVTSYRQTVRAYPQGGGSYIVAKENLGTTPGLLAAASILIGYVVTASVSATAGAVAITSAMPGLSEHRVLLAIGFILLISVANLRGVRESGILFAVPTYGFVLTIYATVASGLIRCLESCPRAATSDVELHGETGVGLFLILLAFTSGSSALTGVEAVADGVQAFRRPRAKNAAITLAMLGALSVTMFLGVTLLASLLDVRVSEEIVGSRSVLAQIGETIFGRTWMFYVLQAFTAMILIVAANTAYQDFPRLSAILARDGFMPRQFENRGDRLVFSNGVVVLAVFSALLVWAFGGELTRLIAVYLVGVFAAFTLSQAGMVRRWARSREPRWVRNAIINGFGAATTGTVLVVVILTKFATGAWIALTAAPIIVLLLLGVKRHYRAVRSQLHSGSVSVQRANAQHVVLVLTDIDAAAAEALGYIRSFRPPELHPLYVGTRPPAEAQALWEALGRNVPPLEIFKMNHIESVIDYIRSLAPGPNEFVTVVIPELFRKRSLLAAIRRRVTFRLKVRLLKEPSVVVSDVPVLFERGELVGGVDARPFIPNRVDVLVFVSAVHDATMRAVNYAKSLGAAETRAVFVALDPTESEEMIKQWSEARMPMPLDVVEAPFRDLAPPVLDEVRRVTADPHSVAAVIVPELVVRRWWHRLLHNVKSLFMKRLLLFEPRVILSSVPFQLR